MSYFEAFSDSESENMAMKTRRSGDQAQFCPESDDEELFNSTKDIPNDGKGKRVAFALHVNKRQARKCVSLCVLQTEDRVSDGSDFAFIRDKVGITVRYFMNIGITVIIAVLAGLLHWAHLTNLFENDKHFSHLSSIEKEMAFRTEMGLYYSYFKVFINAPSFLHGLHLIMNDRFSEYPLVINALKRFNLYPEVFLGSLFRIYTGTMDFFGIPTKACWNVNRADGLNPVESCEGMGDAAYFYVSCVFLLNGVMMSLFYIYGTYLSGSRLGGVVTVLCLFFNHGESTRVMWTPPLRESFSYPFFVLQMLLLTRILRRSKLERRSLVALGACNVLFLLPWPFAQFVLLTQIACLFACNFMGYLSTSKMKSLLVVHLGSFAICFVMLFGKLELLTSFYISSLVAGWAIIALRDDITRVCKHGIVTIFVQGIAWFTSTVLLKFFMSFILGASNDAHIGNLIRSKLTNYKDFHTLMYTCAAEFDFMELETLLGYVKTLILPVNIVIVAIISGKAIKEVWRSLRHERVDSKEDVDIDTEQMAKLANGEMVYHSLQLVAFAVLAILVMRIKLFLAPLMCLMASLICSRQLFGWIGEHFKCHITVFGILSIMAIQGVANFQSQRGIVGDFSNLPQEQLLEWINANTMPNAVFAGSMPTMASVKLSTGRAIVNHPHYEDTWQKERTKLVYTMYSRKPAKEVKRNLMQLQADYFILEDSWCNRRSRPGCSMPEIWDVEDQENRGKLPLCTLLSIDSRPHFTTMFENKVYKVLKIPKDAK
uniref:probable C-mannosyltransferase DPY19L1 n=1 Tax=Oncorhynchus gorbuscha TaxID=8017 RepID=UPI001EAF6745|nr:probable C-mannosyltransferase DPY19L1 [Oncorhynchus gorbuscha]